MPATAWLLVIKRVVGPMYWGFVLVGRLCYVQTLFAHCFCAPRLWCLSICLMCVQSRAAIYRRL